VAPLPRPVCPSRIKSARSGTRARVVAFPPSKRRSAFGPNRRPRVKNKNSAPPFGSRYALGLGGGSSTTSGGSSRRGIGIGGGRVAAVGGCLAAGAFPVAGRKGRASDWDGVLCDFGRNRLGGRHAALLTPEGQLTVGRNPDAKGSRPQKAGSGVAGAAGKDGRWSRSSSGGRGTKLRLCRERAAPGWGIISTPPLLNWHGLQHHWLRDYLLAADRSDRPGLHLPASNEVNSSTEAEQSKISKISDNRSVRSNRLKIF
jgi:hypothetical protein